MPSGSGYLQWIVLLLGAIVLLLGLLLWQFVGDDIGRAWDDFWWSNGDRFWGRALYVVAFVIVSGIVGAIWRALFPPKHEVEARAQRDVEARRND